MNDEWMTFSTTFSHRATKPSTIRQHHRAVQSPGIAMRTATVTQCRWPLLFPPFLLISVLRNGRMTGVSYLRVTRARLRHYAKPEDDPQVDNP